jgi:ribosomal protein L6P/L9E
LLKSLLATHHKKYGVILRLRGSNFRFQISNILNLEVGKSHKTTFAIPKNINVARYLESKDSFFIKGLSVIDVNNFVFKLRNLKPVNPYTGSGLLFNKEKIALKQGKKK